MLSYILMIVYFICLLPLIITSICIFLNKNFSFKSKYFSLTVNVKKDDNTKV